MKKLKLLYIEDDLDNSRLLVSVLNDENICGYSIEITAISEFDQSAIDKIRNNKPHIVILDIYKGKPEFRIEDGLNILSDIQTKLFIPIIFYSGNTSGVKELKSQVVGVATKGDGGIDELKTEIERLIKSNIPFIKERVHSHLENEFKTYFWDIVHEKREIFKPELNDLSLSYLMLRRFANSLSKEKISQIISLSDQSGKAHPMEFYLYPTKEGEYQQGEILKKDSEYFVILTSSCDFIQRSIDKPRKAKKVLLTKTIALSTTIEYTKYKEDETKKDIKNKLIDLIKAKEDRYFFLPKTPFIDNRVIDFQLQEVVDYDDLINYERIATFDSPFAESMISSFIRYYNRIGFPDIDTDLVIGKL